MTCRGAPTDIPYGQAAWEVADGDGDGTIEYVEFAAVGSRPGWRTFFKAAIPTRSMRTPRPG